MRLKSLLLATTIVTVLHPAHQASAAVHKSTRVTTPAKGTVKTTGKKTVVRQAAAAPRRAHAVDSNSNEQMIVTGTHAFNRRARDSTSPISVLTAATLRRSGQMNLADAIVRTDPSITVNAVGADAGALTSSIRMRGLNPNEVLVLVDGKRRHTTANIYADAGPQQGSTPVDLNMIPASAIDHIEILRDGAAAMYGSDAIAGVVNIILKKTPHGLNMTAQTGANAYNGDGWQYQLGADGGFGFLGDGYVHISGQMYHTDHMVPNTTDVRTVPGNPEYKGYTVPHDSNKILSTPEETRENLSIEFGKTLTEGVKGYGLITYAHRHSEAYENYRMPSVAPTLYPYGFSPLETIEENDYAATLGLKGDNFLGFSWDLSSTYGADEDDVGNKNTANPNLIKETGTSPTTVRAETYRLSQWTNNLDFRRQLKIADLVPVTVAFGGEHRLETYQIWPGEIASYTQGGTQGYAGLMPENSGKWSRDVWAAYLDGDFHPLKHWDLDFAGRFEHYTDVGNTENGKVSTRYDITKRIAVRATISNGFRAPTLPEENFSSLNVSPTGASGLLSTSSAAGKSLGAQHLKPERSTSAEGGIILEPVDGWHISADVYQINIRDRISGAGSVYGDSAISAIAMTGATLPTGITTADVSANYFANVGSTRTQGLDIQSDYLLHMHQYGNLDLTMALNLNRTRVNHINTNSQGNPYLNEQSIAYLTSTSPRSKIILNAYWTIGKWDVNVRQTRYGETTSMLTYQDQTPASLTCKGQSLQYSNVCWGQFKNTPVWLTDLEVGYRLNHMWHFAVGANNIFNQRPRRLSKYLNYLGANMYDTDSSGIGIAGGYYYGRINATF
ncbi:TonB-dependent outer membrane siderophore receptor [Gluconobacter thailandicus F149-1 = NBRC 100600]|uniref:Ferric enterobactin receptor n=1 Tax=Gluconobacter thailandicus NBRC 3257 TaxID=1381097 RepID=A0ABQ0IUX8_GLUTH|nr:TonB-dependent receptor [Gluconobacter thailandicus]AFW01026.1 TonB-dependent receptor [Gluconobacter oxydans H24]ANQ40325.1 TonB-dependent receptor [Gluconobacter oxydans]GAN90383.1 TonB-dependent outer membrane siderophore receptor [Gluconobacter frateurii M-2]KXV52163.1 TonB-dependent receptor [Gluconobacter thailandicus]GAC86450.1 ferric enterobactin receptor [Gluconobacter thailandicus NBRC 3255]